MDRVERLEVEHLVSRDGLAVLQAAEHRQVDRVLVLGARGQRRLEDHLLGGGSGDREGLAQRQLVLRQRAGLVRAEQVHARQFLDGHQPADDRLPLGEDAGPDRHRDGQYRRHRHRDGRHRQHQGKLEGGNHVVAAEQGHRQDQEDEGDGDDDEEVADLQDGALEVADIDGPSTSWAVVPK